MTFGSYFLYLKPQPIARFCPGRRKRHTLRTVFIGG
jgi:hypothetical protein